MKKRYLFFLRHYNDIDNIAPAIYYFLKENENHIADVILYDGNYDYRDNENLLFLKTTYGDRFSYIWLGKYLGIDPADHFKSKEMTKDDESKNNIFLHLKGIIKSFIKGILRIMNISVSSVKKKVAKIKVFDETKNKSSIDISGVCRRVDGSHEMADDAIQKILSGELFPSLVIFDINRTPEVKGLLDSLRKYGVKKIICLPVSPLISYNTLRQEKLIDLKSDQFYRLHDYSGFDAIGYVDNYFVESYNKTFDLIGIESTLKNKTKALGSIRYSPNWLKKRESYVKPYSNDTEKIKTVFFLSHPVSNVNWGEVERIYEFFVNYPQYYVVVKHHTRDKAIQDQARFQHLKFVDDINSSSLINWADVVFFWNTSVAIEGYIKNKKMVCLSYVSCNKNLYELFDAGIVVKCRDDLHEFLQLYSHSKDLLRYNHEGVKQLLDSTILPGGDNVIGNYLSYMRDNEIV